VKVYKHIIQIIKVISILCICCKYLYAQSGYPIPQAPVPPRLAMDYTNTLDASQLATLENNLLSFNDSTGNQIAVILISSTQGEPIEDLAYKWAKTWGIGKAKNDNGVLLLIAKDDRKVRIEVGSGLEGAIPDIIAKEIIKVDLAPYFKAGDYYNGILNASNTLMQASQYEYKDVPNRYKNDKDGIGLGEIIFVILIVMIILYWLSRNNRNGNQYMSRRGMRDWDRGGGFIWLPGGGGSDWGGRSSGGGGDFGGFGGFGGGGFSGGGASGDW
jgi:uncharacterized protein